MRQHYPEPGRERKTNSRDTRRWCKGKVGQEHNYTWTVDTRYNFGGRRDWYKLACSDCGKWKNFCSGVWLGCICGNHKVARVEGGR